MNDLALNDITLILSDDMNVSMSIEIYVKYDKPFILTKNDKGTYLKLIQAKPNNHTLEIKNQRNKFESDKNQRIKYDFFIKNNNKNK